MSELSCDTLHAYMYVFIGRNETHDLSRYQKLIVYRSDEALGIVCMRCSFRRGPRVHAWQSSSSFRATAVLRARFVASAGLGIARAAFGRAAAPPTVAKAPPAAANGRLVTVGLHAAIATAVLNAPSMDPRS